MRALLLVLTFAFLLPLALPAEAQILNRLRNRAQKAAEREAEERVAREAERRAAEAAANAMDGVFGAEDSLAARPGAFAVPGMAGVVPGMGAGHAGPLADFRQLQTFLPATAAGLPRTDLTGESGGAMGMAMSQASAAYEGSGAQVDLSIVDAGTMSGYLGMAAAWQTAQIDQQSAEGFQRTTEVGGFPAFVEEDRSGRQTESGVTVVIGQRLLVQASATDMGADALAGLVASLDLAGLSAVADELAAQGPQIVGFRDLIPLLPAGSDGATREQPTGETSSGYGFETSEASATYCRAAADCFAVTIADFGGAGGLFGSLPFAAWASASFDRETTEGYERTTEVAGHPAQEQYARAQGITSLETLVAGRFLVTVDGRIAPEAARALVEQMDLAALEARAGQ